jgi:hypothetical protein
MQIILDSWKTKWHWGIFSQCTSVSVANQSTDSPSSGPGIADQIMANVPSGLRITPTQESKTETEEASNTILFSYFIIYFNFKWVFTHWH